MSLNKQEREWKSLYDAIGRTLVPFGKPDAFGMADYLLVDDNWGNYQQKIEIQNLVLLKSDVVALLQKLLVGYPDWEIVVGVDGNLNWPPMGLTIRDNEIIDGLQRQYLPPEWQNIHYEGGRPA